MMSAQDRVWVYAMMQAKDKGVKVDPKKRAKVFSKV